MLWLANQCEFMTCAYWEFVVHGEHLQTPIPGTKEVQQVNRTPRPERKRWFKGITNLLLLNLVQLEPPVSLRRIKCTPAVTPHQKTVARLHPYEHITIATPYIHSQTPPRQHFQKYYYVLRWHLIMTKRNKQWRGLKYETGQMPVKYVYLAGQSLVRYRN